MAAFFRRFQTVASTNTSPPSHFTSIYENIPVCSGRTRNFSGIPNYAVLPFLVPSFIMNVAHQVLKSNLPLLDP